MTEQKARRFFLITLLGVMALTLNTRAQTGSTSPYSRYGIGDIIQDGFTFQTSMGGIGAGLVSPTNINFLNPASYASDTITVFEFGAKGEIRRLETQKLSNDLNSASFSYFSLAFPIIKSRLSAAFGLMPYSSVGYNIVSSSALPNIGNLSYKFEGTGGYNKFFLGTGVRLNSHFSVGMNASYLFGTIENRRTVEFPTGTNYFNSRFINSNRLQDVLFSFGGLYETNLKKDWKLKVGLTGYSQTKLCAINDQYYYNYAISAFGTEIVKDSVYTLNNVKGKIVLPAYIRAGFTLSKNNWLAGADFSIQDWSSYKSFDTKDSLSQSFCFNMGGEYKTSKFAYRLGAKYNQTYLNLKSTQINDISVSFGFAFIKSLAKRPPSTINVALELGQLGSVDNNLVRERYVRIHLGLSLADIWFIQPKYD